MRSQPSTRRLRYSEVNGQLIASPRNWSFLFYVLAGLGAIPLVLGWFAMPWDRKAFTGSKVPRMDWIGGLLVTSGLSLFMFSLTQSGVLERGWSEPCKTFSIIKGTELTSQTYLSCLSSLSPYWSPFYSGNDTSRIERHTRPSPSSPSSLVTDIASPP